MVFYERLGRDIDRGLVGYWKLDDLKVSTSTAIGRANFNDGNIVGATVADGQNWSPSNSMSFDGIDNYVDCGNDSSLSQLNNWTISFWIKVKVAPSSGGDPIVDKWEAGVGGFSINIHSSKKLIIFFNGDGGTYLYTYAVLDLDKWYHCTIVKKNTAGVNAFWYINGVFNKSSEEEQVLTGTANPLWIGRGRHYNYYFDGLISNVRIYNRALTTGEVSKLYRLRL